VPVRARAELTEHGEGEHLHAPAEDVVRGQPLVAHRPEVLRARVGHVDHHLRRDLRAEADLLVEEVPPRRVLELVQQRLGGEPPRLDEAHLDPEVGQRLGVALRAGALAGELDLDELGRHDLEQAEVQERDAAVVEQQEVPGCGSPEN
jgi:hypothetical protein